MTLKSDYYCDNVGVRPLEKPVQGKSLVLHYYPPKRSFVLETKGKSNNSTSYYHHQLNKIPRIRCSHTDANTGWSHTDTLTNTLAQPCFNRHSQRVHHSKINLTTEVHNLEFLKFPRVHTQNFQSHFFCLRDIAHSTRFTRSDEWLPSKKKHQNLSTHHQS